MNTLHLVVTSLCDRECKWCCNKQYDIKNLQYASDEDFRWAEMLCLTGGEPFEFANPCELAYYYRLKYRNLKYVIVYSNAKELYDYTSLGGKIYSVDGINVSIKNDEDLTSLKLIIPFIEGLSMNRVYDFTEKVSPNYDSCYELIHREWQKNFVPAENCRFKRGN